MSRLTIRHGGVLKCDMPGCGESFTTYSVVAKTRLQALSAGWARVKYAFFILGMQMMLVGGMCFGRWLEIRE